MSDRRSGDVLGINNERLAAKVEQIRTEQMERVRRRLGSAVPAHVLSEAWLTDVSAAIREEELERVWQHPDYPEMARRFAALGAPRTADNELVNHALRDSARLVAGIWALYLHAGGGLTHSRLDALLDVAGSGGRARSYAMITYMRFLGYIEPCEAAVDGRERRYQPTDRMRGAFRRYFADQLEIGRMLEPRVQSMLERMHDPAAFDPFMAVLGEGLLISALLHRLNTGPSLNVFSGRRSGMVILWELLLMAPSGEVWPTREAFPYTVAELARRCAVSRTHVLRTLREAEAVGMLALEGEGRIRIPDMLRVEVNSFVALSLICLNACALGVTDPADGAAGSG